MRIIRTGRAGGARTMLGLGLLAAAVVAGGLLLYGALGGGARAEAAQDVPPQARPSAPTPEQGLGERVGKAIGRIAAPGETQMRLTVPEMERVDGVPVFTAPADDEETLDRGALHVEGTGYPWQEGANVYIAGHRLGYGGTGSYLLFHDLDELERGDEVILEDAEGRRYVYRVFRSFKVDPSYGAAMDPVPGRDVVSLQTCTLPDYRQRLVVQAELAGVER